MAEHVREESSRELDNGARELSAVNELAKNEGLRESSQLSQSRAMEEGHASMSEDLSNENIVEPICFASATSLEELKSNFEVPGVLNQTNRVLSLRDDLRKRDGIFRSDKAFLEGLVAVFSVEGGLGLETFSLELLNSEELSVDLRGAVLDKMSSLETLTEEHLFEIIKKEFSRSEVSYETLEKIALLVRNNEGEDGVVRSLCDEIHGLFYSEVAERRELEHHAIKLERRAALLSYFPENTVAKEMLSSLFEKRDEKSERLRRRWESLFESDCLNRDPGTLVAGLLGGIVGFGLGAGLSASAVPAADLLGASLILGSASVAAVAGAVMGVFATTFSRPFLSDLDHHSGSLAKALLKTGEDSHFARESIAQAITRGDLSPKKYEAQDFWKNQESWKVSWLESLLQSDSQNDHRIIAHLLPYQLASGEPNDQLVGATAEFLQLNRSTDPMINKLLQTAYELALLDRDGPIESEVSLKRELRTLQAKIL